MKLLMFGSLFAVFSLVFLVLMPGFLKVLSFVPFSLSLLCFGRLVITQKLGRAEAAYEDRRRLALREASRKVGLVGVPQDINGLMEQASMKGKEIEAFRVYEKAMEKKPVGSRN